MSFSLALLTISHHSRVPLGAGLVLARSAGADAEGAQATATAPPAEARVAKTPRLVHRCPSMPGLPSPAPPQGSQSPVRARAQAVFLKRRRRAYPTPATRRKRHTGVRAR